MYDGMLCFIVYCGNIIGILVVDWDEERDVNVVDERRVENNDFIIIFGGKIVIESTLWLISNDIPQALCRLTYRRSPWVSSCNLKVQSY